MSLMLMGKKRGMTRIFDEQGNAIVCTVIEAEPNVITQIKNQEKDGYQAVQLAAIKLPKSRIKNIGKPLIGHFTRAQVEPRSDLCETRVKDVEAYTLGQEFGVDHFPENSFVDVIGMSKGKGHQGVIKRHGFSGGRASHGSGFHRHGGSTGMRSSPGRCLPGQKKSGHMGAERVTVQNLKVVRVDQEKNVLLIEGSIPGATGGLVYISKAKKKSVKKTPPPKKAKK